MTKAELIEALSDAQHHSWSRWVSFIFEQCQRQRDGSMVIPTGLAVKWMKEVETAYAELQEGRKHLYHQEVERILPIIEAYKQPNLLTPERVNAALNTPIKHSPLGEQLEKETWK